jgi:PAS domain S-box-containing protein
MKHLILNILLIFFLAAHSHAQDASDGERLPPALQNHTSVILLIDPTDGRILDANTSAVEFYGYTLERLRRMRIQEINALLPKEVEEEYKKAKAADRNYFLFPHRLADGQLRTVEVYSAPFVTTMGKTLLLSIIHDATEKFVMEGELRQYQDRLEALVAVRTQGAINAHKRLYALAFASLVLLFVLVVFLFRKQQQSAFYRRQSVMEQERAALLERFEYLNRYANDIILLVDDEGQIVEANERAVTTYGFPREELLRKNIREIRAPENESDYESVQKQANVVAGYIYQAIHLDRSGRSFPVESSVRMVRIGEQQYYQHITRDISDRKQAEEKIRQVNQQLQISNEEKDKLFAIIAHDLKSPMSGLLSSTEMLANEPELFSEKDIRTLSTELHKSAKYTFALLEDLLQWARMSQGGIDFAPGPCNLRELVNMSLYSAQNVASQKEITITTNIPQGLTVQVDQPMGNTVIRNLLFNAVKFTRRGGEIAVTAKQEGPTATVAIQDTGVGMNEQVLSSLFTLEKEKRQLGTEGEKGTGLGLVLCKQFIEQHGGRIWVESEPGKGTTVFFTLSVSD